MLKMKVIVIFTVLIITYVQADVQSCKILKRLYEVFDCIPRCVDAKTLEPTKYSCKNSSYVLNFDLDTCYFEKEKYQIGESVETHYPNPEGTNMCAYTCVGGYFDFEVISDLPIRTDQTCISSTLYYQDQFYNFQAPIYSQNSEGVAALCPYRWTSDAGDVDSPNNPPCENEADCCNFQGRPYRIGEEILYNGQDTKCFCGCPPLMHCFSTGE